jgi:hypothetical protein
MPQTHDAPLGVCLRPVLTRMPNGTRQFTADKPHNAPRPQFLQLVTSSAIVPVPELFTGYVLVQLQFNLTTRYQSCHSSGQ